MAETGITSGDIDNPYLYDVNAPDFDFQSLQGYVNGNQNNPWYSYTTFSGNEYADATQSNPMGNGEVIGTESYSAPYYINSAGQATQANPIAGEEIGDWTPGNTIVYGSATPYSSTIPANGSVTSEGGQLYGINSQGQLTGAPSNLTNYAPTIGATGPTSQTASTPFTGFEYGNNGSLGILAGSFGPTGQGQFVQSQNGGNTGIFADANAPTTVNSPNNPSLGTFTAWNPLTGNPSTTNPNPALQALKNQGAN